MAFSRPGFPKEKNLTNHIARDLDDSAHYFFKIFTDPNFGTDRMNFQLIPHAAFMVMVYSYPVCPYYYSPPNSRSCFHIGPLHWSTLSWLVLHECLCPSHTCTFPFALYFSCALTPPPPYLSTFLNIGCMLECPGER